MRHCHIFIGFETALEIPPTNITIKCVESFDDRKEVVGTSDSHPLIGSNRIDVVSKEADNEMSEPEPWQTPKNIFFGWKAFKASTAHNFCQISHKSP